VAATLENAEEILAAVWDYCFPRGIAFKFVRSSDHLFLANVKHAHRGSSGKFITIYPLDESQFELILEELGEILAGQPGPYILSDLRVGAGPLYVRYGGFAERYCIGPDGELALAIEAGDGTLIPDRRGPTFEVPPWVALPDVLQPHLAERNSATVDELPYQIERALHFSNGGGVYAGTDRRTGEKVVLKEARPHAGLAMDGADAVSRLRREREMLERLAGLDLVPAVRDYFTWGEHEFLVEDFVEGEKLSSLLVSRYPLTAQETDEATAREYAAWALELCRLVEEAAEAAHGRGVVLGDLHPSNVLVRPDGGVALIDLEGGWRIGEERRQTLADPAFIAPADRTGFEIDRYALACMRIYMFMPLTALFGIHPAKAEGLADAISELFPLPPGFASEAARIVMGPQGPSRHSPAGGKAPGLEPTPTGWLRARDSMARAIIASATPERPDRLYPGDIKQFTTGGLNIAYGAAGVLYALARTGVDHPVEHEEWLAERALHPESGTRLGFYDGLHGVAYVLDELERRDDALRVLEICDAEIGGKWERLGLDLYTGLAGIGLNLAHFAEATGEASLWDSVWKVADVVAERLGEEDSVPEISSREHPYAGLTRGSSGPALMFLRLYEHSGDSGLLDLAATALGQDLRRCYRREDGSLEVNEGWRTMPYLADGSVGIGMVLENYLTLRENERFEEAADAIRWAAEAEFYIEPGLFWGRAGMILHLSHRHAPGTGHREPVIAAQVRRLAWHAMTYEGHLAFPGEQLLRLSMDLATGTAGVLLALGAALHEEPVHLPFLDPLGTEQVREDRELVLVNEGR
jgi:tRNA A-37 threonylcarbamoyl transferase component Bud32